MSYYIGVDGGGTKTAFVIAKAGKSPEEEILKTGCSYQMLGIDGAAEVLAEGVRECMQAVKAEPMDIAGCCMGVPCYGENQENDRMLEAALRRKLGSIPFHLVNDVEVGWAGALNCQPGIHIVAGTGAIAFGVGMDGVSARCGGWNEFFGDEGSCYWIGKETMSLFTKEADGREERGVLYHLIRSREEIEEDTEFIDLVLQELAPHRDRVAAFQLYASQAAHSGDMAAIRLYERAARELGMLARALKKQLKLPEITPVTCSGGLFRNEELIFEPLKRELETMGCRLQRASGSPLDGALRLAEQYFGKEKKDA